MPAGFFMLPQYIVTCPQRLQDHSACLMHNHFTSLCHSKDVRSVVPSFRASHVMPKNVVPESPALEASALPLQ